MTSTCLRCLTRIVTGALGGARILWSPPPMGYWPCDGCRHLLLRLRVYAPSWGIG